MILGSRNKENGSGNLRPGSLARIGDQMMDGISKHGVGTTGTLVEDGLNIVNGMSAKTDTHGETVRQKHQMLASPRQVEVNVESKLVLWTCQLQAPVLWMRNPEGPGKPRQEKK